MVYRTTKSHDRESGWEKQIVDLGDGRSVHAIMRALYDGQLERGAGLVDVGTWKSFFESSVVESIGGLVTEGYIQVRPASET